MIPVLNSLFFQSIFTLGEKQTNKKTKHTRKRNSLDTNQPSTVILLSHSFLLVSVFCMFLLGTNLYFLSFCSIANLLFFLNNCFLQCIAFKKAAQNHDLKNNFILKDTLIFFKPWCFTKFN